ncbi:unnamed protein product [Parascedosporium putredinis]|uniref:AMP-dependent synthetase/ligase domain-containing protein n=1 Tax=Parascedosporium putredinis TaxID=1442378 RepID=A0A9P1H7G4_9PEZI|nr:unnamed protein product [Parascedosporium putredinis]CAI8001199.1 unnamed protein product [Parascedosporium putredinis]
MKLLNPTALMSVPRLFNKFNSALRTATIEAEGVKGALSRHVIETKKANMKKPAGAASNTHILYDRIWTPKVRAALGLQRCHTMLSGSAMLDPDVHEFLRAAFGNSFGQGYGLTESYAVATFQLRQDFSLGSVGPPAPVSRFAWSRGPCIFREYHKNEEETKKALEADGWFHTGDIAEIDSLGRIKIIDRKKNVLKLSQGDLVAIFGVDPVAFAPWASNILKKPVDPTNAEGLKAAGAEPAVRKAFLKILDDIGKRHKFNSFEKVRGCLLLVDPFTVENELLTPTLKLKRAPAAKAFKAEIARMYQEIEADPASTAKAKL